MNDLIKREDVMALWDKYHYEIATKAVEFDRALRQLPSAEPKKGKWKEWVDERWGATYYSCSECGSDAIFNSKGKRLLTKYCPSCGARMEE